jgi:VanZ family protein
VIAWAALIFAASSRPDLRVSSDDLLDFVLRKAAHVFVFGVLAVLLARLLRGDGPPRPMIHVWAWILTLAYAISDEWHQTFVEGRVGHPIDVAIDMVGATIALALLHHAWRRTVRRQERTTP